ncbi:hypothetical protein [Pseudofrankia saprophytica]|uniref:hypothetical protein n=1 Tax=Pseudofrankia saprophytica TaxID=298655 RepID=UPI000234C7EF|nr:hypothetical protein [Pseudofrankia saprophytica]
MEPQDVTDGLHRDDPTIPAVNGAKGRRMSGLQVTGNVILVEDSRRAENVVIAQVAGDATTFSAVANWGDGTTDTEAKVVSTGVRSFVVVGSHHFDEPGDFVVTIRLSNNDLTTYVATASALVGSSRLRFACRAFRRLVGRPARNRELDEIAGETNDAVLNSIVATKYFRERIVRDVYGRLLAKVPDQAELEQGIEIVAAAGTAALTAQLATSDEYFDRRGYARPAGVVNAFYTDLLGRSPTSEESANALTAAAEPAQRAELVARLLRSPDAGAQAAQLAVRAYAGRAPSPQEIADWLTNGRVWPEAIAVALGRVMPESFPGDPDGIPDGAVADLAIQAGFELPDEVVQGLVSFVGRLVSDLFPGLPLRVESLVGQGQTLVAAWIAPPSDDSIRAWMTRTSGDGKIIAGAETFGFFASLAFLKKGAQQVFEGFPKRLDTNGVPNPDGDVSLTGIDVELDAAHQAVVTHVSGVYLIPVFGATYGVRFTDHIRDQFGAETRMSRDCAGTMSTRIRIEESNSRDWNGEDWAGAAFLGAVFFVPGGIEIATNVISAYTSHGGGGGGDGDVSGSGLGAVFADRLPRSLLFNGLKLVLNYSNSEVGGSGLTLRGTHGLAAPVPSISIDGPTFIPFFLGGPGMVRVTYSLHMPLCDVPGGLSVIWRLGNDVTGRTNTDSPEVAVNIPAPGIRVGSTGRRTLTASVEDKNRTVATATLDIHTQLQPRQPLPPRPPGYLGAWPPPGLWPPK